MLQRFDPLARYWARLGTKRPAVRQLLHSVRDANLTYVGIPKLRRLAEMALLVRARRVPGAYLEAGVALGGSAAILGKLKPPGARLDLYDVFETIPPPGPEDAQDAHERYQVITSGQSRGLGSDVYYGYKGDLQPVVAANLAKFDLDLQRDQIRLTRGLFQDTLYPTGPIAFAHVDCDWYEPIRICLERIVPKLSPGGVIVIDDYDSYAGARKAVDEFLAGTHSLEVMFKERSIGLRKC